MESVVVIGNFDGVHRGHQALLAQARALADARSLRCVVLTFDPHPAIVLGKSPKPALTTVTRRVELLRQHGADDVVVQPFDLEFAAWSPERFAEDLLRKQLGAKVVVVGQNFRFGHARAGEPKLLETFGFECVAATIVGDAKGKFSSGRVRDAIAAGDLAEATNVLGRPHELSGVVAQGDRLGRTIGFPTANLDGVAELLPPYGVYAVHVDEVVNGVATRLAKGAMNIGVRPTVGGASLRIEAHLLDWSGDLYGKTLRTHLVARLREERKLAGLDALKAQIAEDVKGARAVLA